MIAPVHTRTPITFPATLDTVDLIAIEAHARQLRAQAFARMTRAAFAWVVARLTPAARLRDA